MTHENWNWLHGAFVGLIIGLVIAALLVFCADPGFWKSLILTLFFSGGGAIIGGNATKR